MPSARFVYINQLIFSLMNHLVIMKGATLLTLVLIGCVAGDGAWEQNKEYTYKLSAKTFKHLPQSNNELVGVISRAYLTIRPQSDDLLIGQITQAQYTKVDQQNAQKLNPDNFENLPMQLPFKIHLQNGVIRSLSVDNSLSNYEINQLKVIISQLQVDTNAQNQIEFSDNQLPRKDSDNALYKTMETLVTGNCETVYDISPIPDYLIGSHPEWVPLPALKSTGRFIQIVKSRSLDNCHESSSYLLDVADHKDYKDNEMRRNDLYIKETRRIVISGSLDNYTIQSSVTVNDVLNGRNGNGQVMHDYVNVTLQSVEPSSTRPQFAPESLKNMKNIGNLVYNYDSYHNTPTTGVNSKPRLYLTSTGSGAPEERWSACWTQFPTSLTICKSEFGPEFEDIKIVNCGFLSLGKQILCRKNYPECVATPCFTAFIHRFELCERSFGNDWITKGGFDDCSLGFYRSRCCPKVYN